MTKKKQTRFAEQMTRYGEELQKRMPRDTITLGPINFPPLKKPVWQRITNAWRELTS